MVDDMSAGNDHMESRGEDGLDVGKETDHWLANRKIWHVLPCQAE